MLGLAHTWAVMAGLNSAHVDRILTAIGPLTVAQYGIDA